ncbi:hypothetical protein HNQ51_001340 [Inhella inkyongensis]|uniref:DUF3995 domain-containing protein n=1 Tax=Inhella inkyongensis TaxID=392593 RepID=A0A840RZ47_9BURK|nr:hypothetical protein [Inhella inkyongensis]MBB5204047.1 hypothetical protein [Inhella inkyongensis]
MSSVRLAALIGAGIAFFGTLIHWVAPLLGPDWYAFLTSPAWVVASARAQTWEAPAGALGVGALMGMCGLFALSAAGLMQRLPLLRAGLAVSALVCTLRGLLLIPFLIRVPERLTAFDITASLVWLLAGLCFVWVALRRWRDLSAATPSQD